MRTLLLAALIAATVVTVSDASSSGQAAPPRAASPVPAVVDLLDAYWQGDMDVVAARFTTGADVAAVVPRMRAWSRSAAARMWRQAGLVLALDLAATALTLPDPLPVAAAELVDLGLDEALRRRPRDETALPLTFVRTWNETAVALQVAAGADSQALESIRRLSERGDDGVTPRMWLARGVATEQRGAPDATRALEDAVRAYDRAAREPLVRSEASARAAHALIRLSRHRDAIRRLDVAGEGTEDVLVASWLAYLRGLAHAGLGEGALALAAHEQAIALAPDAAPAHAGRALALRLLAREAEATAPPPGASDPWTVLDHGDRRTIADGLRRLKATLATAATADRGAARPPVLDSLDAYARGEYDVVIGTLLATKSLEQFSSDIRDHADRWIAEAPPSATEARERVLAIVALEAARARGVADWPRAHLLVEWACERLRAPPEPDDFERRWLHAAAAVMAGAVQPATLEVHVTHALQRLPDEPALVLDRAIAAELRAGPDNRSPFGLRSPGGRLDLVTTRLQQAAEHDVLRAEAHLRLGYTALRRGREEEADELLALPATSPDPFVRYLAHLFRGRAFDKLNRPADAVRAYEVALTVVPGAQTAEIALAAALSRLGEHGRSAEVAERALTRPATAQDPWLYYGQGPFRHWSLIVAGLRQDAR